MRMREATLQFVVNPQTVRADGTRVQPFDGPLAILVDALTASTSEVFTGGMKAIGRARVFGEATAGQALPALVATLPNGDRLMHVVADFTAPDGTRLEGGGVSPDVFVPLRREALLAGQDPTLEAALEWIASESR
jgi:carboxyl-terminal processing protease